MADSSAESVPQNLEQNSPYYKEYESRGHVYVLNETNKDVSELLEQMKGLGFTTKICSKRDELESKIKSDVQDPAKFIDDFCVAVLVVTNSKNIGEINLIRHFHEDSCANLECKPKLFFFLRVPDGHQDGIEHTNELSGGSKDNPLSVADIFIYKDTASTAVEDLCRFIKTLNAEDGKNYYVTNKLKTYLKTIKRSIKKPEKNPSKIITKPKPTTHDSLTRRLMLGPKPVCISVRIGK